MKFRSLLMGGVLVALMGIGAVGCNENPVDDPGTGNAPAKPTNLAASSASATSVILNWTAPDTGLTYSVSWTPSTSASPMTVTGTTATVTGLTANTLYTFEVKSVRNSVMSTTGDTLSWMGAGRYTGGTTTFKIYEKDAPVPNPSGFTLDVSKGGPIPLSLAMSNAANASKAQIAVVMHNGTNGNPDTVEIGPAYAFDEYANVAQFDSSVYTSQTTFLATSMDTWFTRQPLNTFVTYASGTNLKAFPIVGNVGTDTRGHGFYVRTGTTGNFHFARVFVKNKNGKIIQDAAPNRYVEVEVSYQEAPNAPYAKVAEAPAGITARNPRLW